MFNKTEQDEYKYLEDLKLKLRNVWISIDEKVKEYAKEIRKQKEYLSENKTGMDHVEKIDVRRTVDQAVLTGDAVQAKKKRIQKLLKDIVKWMGDRRGMLSREMTKPHEEFIRGRISDILHRLDKRPVVKGECTLLVSGKTEMAPVPMFCNLQAAIMSSMTASKSPMRVVDNTVAVSFRPVFGLRTICNKPSLSRSASKR